MKIINNHSDLVEDQIGDIDSIEASIDNKDVGFMFDLFSNQLYANPEGSIVREITSNCFDSHTEAKVDDPVIVKLYKEDSQYWLGFQDVGVGLSPDRMKKVYMKYLSSTKRDSNDYIGAFGLGSKSPLSYASYFQIITRFDGIEYHYIMHKAASKPKLEPLLQITTDQRNGTLIKVPIENRDVSKFESELYRQLYYFDNVYIEGVNNFDNDYKVYNFKSFRFRAAGKTYRYNDTAWHEEMHIVIDKVAYPIDWNTIGIQKIKAPIGILFPIGVLSVTPNRESLRYNDEVKTLIIDKIAECKAELQAYANNVENWCFDSIKDYLDAQNALKQTSVLKIKVLDAVINITKDTNNDKDPFFITPPPFKWKPLAHLPISFNKSPFFEYHIVKEVGEAGIVKKAEVAGFDSIKLGKNRFTIVNQGETYSRLKNYQLGKETLMVTRKKLGYEEISENLIFEDRRKRTAFVNKKIERARTPYVFGEWNKTKTICEFRRIIAATIAEFGTVYSDIVVTEATKTGYRNLFEKRKRAEGTFNAIVCTGGATKTSSDSKSSISVKWLDEFKGIMIYGIKEEIDQLKGMFKTCANHFLKGYRGYDSVEKYTDFCVLATSVSFYQKYFKNSGKPNFFSLQEVMSGKCPQMNTLICNKWCINSLESSTKYSEYLKQHTSVEFMRYYSLDLYESLICLKKEAQSHERSCLSTTQLEQAMRSIKLTDEYKNSELVTHYKKVLNFFEDLHLLGNSYHSICLTGVTTSQKLDVVIYMKAKGKELNIEHHFVPTEEEAKWLEEGKNIQEYRESLKSKRVYRKL